jgi:hypothetical protein
MVTEKNVRITLNTGLEIVVPRYSINKIVLPSVVINRNFHRLVVSSNDLNNNLNRVKKKFRLG